MNSAQHQKSSRLMFSGLIIVLLTASATTTDAETEPARDISRIHITERQLREAVASRTLTWLTGTSANNDVISVGRMANYFGFVGLRVASGHSLSRSDVAKDTLFVLDNRQRNVLVNLVQEQKPIFQDTHNARFKINRALEALLLGETESEDAFLDLGRSYGASEAALGRVIAQRLGEVAQSLSSSQMQALHEIRAAHISGNRQVRSRRGIKMSLSKEDKKELVNLAARLLSWTTGSETFNDFEVVGKPSQHFGFVSLRIESNHAVRRGAVANEVLEMLTPKQQALLFDAASHNATTFSRFLKARGALMRALETSQVGDTIDPEQVTKLGSVVGEIEASMTWAQAMAMIKVRKSLNQNQASGLLAMRNKYTLNSPDSLTEDPLERGRQLYAQCVLCHGSTATGKPTVAPGLAGVVGRKIASDPSFDRYSAALVRFADAQHVWSEELLKHFLRSPKLLVPGTNMGFDGLEDSRDRAALIAFLKSRQ